MKCRAAAIVSAVVISVLCVGDASTYPTPSEVAIHWELKIQFDVPRAVQLRPSPTEPFKTYWYMHYTVTNRTGKDRIFVPQFDLYTDTGQVIRAGQRIPSSIFRQIREMQGSPLLRDTIDMVGKLLQGEDNAKEGLAIWPDFAPKAGTIDIFIGGLSGETVVVKLPRPIRTGKRRGAATGPPQTTIVLAKTLHLSYKVPGEAAQRPFITPKRVTKTWVMR